MPARNLVPKPAALSLEEAACLPTAWLTAYRMLFTQSGVQPGDTVLVQGAGGGVATALIRSARRRAIRVWVTSRDEAKGAAGPRARRGPGVRHRGTAAGAGRRRHGDGRRGDVVALAQLAAPRRDDRRLGCDAGDAPARPS